jgi:hypothetical protein
MNAPEGAAAPESGNEVPTFEDLAADPEIAALLDFGRSKDCRRSSGDD